MPFRPPLKAVYKCPSCKKLISIDETICASCGYSVTPEEKSDALSQNNNKLLINYLFRIIFFAIIIIVFMILFTELI